MVKFAHVVIAAVVLLAGASAQQKPNFSGRWGVVSPKEGAGQVQVVTQDEKTLSSYYVSKGPDHKMVYQLDGIERRQAIPSQGTSITILVRAAWDGDRIVITTNTSYPNGMKTQIKETWSLDAQRRLVIDSIETGPNGTPGEIRKIILVKQS